MTYLWLALSCPRPSSQPSIAKPSNTTLRRNINFGSSAKNESRNARRSRQKAYAIFSRSSARASRSPTFVGVALRRRFSFRNPRMRRSSSSVAAKTACRSSLATWIPRGRPRGARRAGTTKAPPLLVRRCHWRKRPPRDWRRRRKKYRLPARVLRRGGRRLAHSSRPSDQLQCRRDSIACVLLPVVQASKFELVINHQTARRKVLWTAPALRHRSAIDWSRQSQSDSKEVRPGNDDGVPKFWRNWRGHDDVMQTRSIRGSGEPVWVSASSNACFRLGPDPRRALWPAASPPHKQAGHMTAPDQCCKNVRKFLPRRRRPHMTQSEHERAAFAAMHSLDLLYSP